MCLCAYMCVCLALLFTEPAGRIARKQRIKTEATGQKPELGVPGEFADVGSLGCPDQGCPSGAAEEQGRAENGVDGSCSRGIPVSRLGKSTLLTAHSGDGAGRSSCLSAPSRPGLAPSLVINLWVPGILEDAAAVGCLPLASGGGLGTFFFSFLENRCSYAK